MKTRIVRPTKTWAPCSPVRREEDRRERVVVRREADARVLDHLRQQERQSHQERQHEPGLHARAVAAADRLQGPVDGEARRDEDRRVDAGDVARELEALGRPRVAVDDADEEVRREERAEEHHLGRDEEQHSEDGRADPRALVRDGRAVVLGGGVRGHSTLDLFQLMRAGAVQQRVPRARHAVLVRAADDLRDLVEVEDRRRRRDLPLERQRTPRVRRARAGRTSTSR